ncbi:TIR domain-containing protein [Deinococcus sp.]|uniref:TIR domain-containing protein n=1 Tax=Deinococcus sp. TaxID=47478 RepID=UPI003B592661
MSELSDDFLAVADQLSAMREQYISSQALRTAQELEAAGILIGKAHSGSWLGYQSRVYYEDYNPVPSDAVFSVEWGLIGGTWESSRGEWRQYSSDETRNYILDIVGKQEVKDAKHSLKTLSENFSGIKDELLSLLSVAIDTANNSPYLTKLQLEAESMDLSRDLSYINSLTPRGGVMSRDTTAITGGMQVPPHVSAVADAIELKSFEYACRRMAEISNSAAKHIQRTSRRNMAATANVDCVYIGHGGSRAWTDLRDLIRYRLHIEFEEFNSQSAAGLTAIERLKEMLEKSTFAFLVMTAEDETVQGQMQARMNVIHEIGLFQGKLGFRKAIILLEDGCAEFSNIHGLTQIRFPRDNINAVSEKIREVLEREGVIANS